MKTCYYFIFPIILLLMATMPAFSQVENNTSKGSEDTITDGGSNYFFQGSWLEYMINANGFGPGYNTYPESVTTGGLFHYNGIMAKKCFTESPLKVVGIAVVGSFVNEVFNEFPEEYLYLYEATPDTFQLLKTVAWNSTDPHKYYNTRNRGSNTDCAREQQEITYSTYELREYYFDTTLTVFDSFYVGFSSFLNIYITPEGRTIYGHNHTPEYVFGGLGISRICRDSWLFDSSCYYPMTTYKLLPNCLNPWTSACFPNLEINVWHWIDIPTFAYVFPIFEIPDTFSCPQVASLQATEADTGCVMLLWDADSAQNEWTVCYGPEGTERDSCNTVTVSEPALRLCGLDTCTKYVAYVRAICHHNDSVYYTEWSDSVTVTFSCDTTSPSYESIATTEKQQLLVMPNPASDHLTVSFHQPLKVIDIFDMQGHRAYTTSANGLSAEIDITTLAPATYIVVAHYADGIVSRKIIVHHGK